MQKHVFYCHSNRTMKKSNQHTNNQQLRAVIVDDEQPARVMLRNLLVKHNIAVVAECANGKDAVTAIAAHFPSVVFLDIQMPGMNGFDVVEAIGIDEMPPIIFVTAFDQHALRAFEVGAVDYLLKPFSLDRFAKTLRRVQEQKQNVSSVARNNRLRKMIEHWKRPTAAIPPVEESKWRQRIIIQEGSRVFALSVTEIDWITSSDHYVTLSSGKKTYLVYEKLSTLESQLYPELFIRIHRTTIINIKAVLHIKKGIYGNYKVIMKDNSSYPVSRSKKPLLVMLMTTIQRNSD